jgi:hypothetical protein
VCVRALPPNPAESVISVGRENTFNLIWSAPSDHLLLFPTYDASLYDVPLGGGDFERIFTPEGVDTDDVDELGFWNPEGPATWVSYFGSPAAGNDLQHYARFWHLQTRQTFEIDVADRTHEVGSWSPDGKYYVLFTRDDAAAERPIFVQEVLADSLGQQWKLEGVNAVLGASYLSDFSWQP